MVTLICWHGLPPLMYTPHLEGGDEASFLCERFAVQLDTYKTIMPRQHHIECQPCEPHRLPLVTPCDSSIG